MPSPIANSALGRTLSAISLFAVLSLSGAALTSASAQEAAPAAAAAATETAAPAVVDPVAVERGFAVWKSQDCVGCHGWAGNGERIGENPRGPNLRAIEMEPEFIKEVVMCGRPGTQMPYHEAAAYSDDRCYGMTKADTAGMELLTGKPITSAEADDLVAYMMDKILGRPEQPNQDDCRAYYGKRPFCDKLATAAEQGL